MLNSLLRDLILYKISFITGGFRSSSLENARAHGNAKSGKDWISMAQIESLSSLDWLGFTYQVRLTSSLARLAPIAQHPHQLVFPFLQKPPCLLYQKQGRSQ
jgi:hypothetical protein